MKTSALHNREKGKRAFILGNGPSVLGHDLTKLKGEVVIGMNASILLEKQYGFESSYYTVSDQRFIERPEKLALSRELSPSAVRVIRAGLQDFDDAELAERTCYVKPIARDGFSKNLNSGFYFGATTVMLAIQLAYYLGANETYILGVDLKYDSTKPRFYDDSDPLPIDQLGSVQIYNIAKAAGKFNGEGRKLFSCSPHSLLRPYIEYMEFENCFSPKTQRAGIRA